MSEINSSEEIVNSIDVPVSTENVGTDSIEEYPTVQIPPPSINDENAFPALGSGTSPTPISWGPSSNTQSSAPVSRKQSPTPAGIARSKTIQEAFNISNLVSLNVSKVEFAKIVNEVKKKHNVSVESTLSSITKNRSFIVNGNPVNVSKARKELIRQLTKPVNTKFKIPAKTRSAVIGSSGKNLRPIIDSTSTRIDIERNTFDSSEDNEDEQIEVTIEGDIDGVEEAKQKILAIVDEETKNLTAKINVTDRLLPFIQPFDFKSETLSIAGPNKNRVITISGLRDEVLVKKAEISNQLETLDIKTKTESKTIPTRLHQFIYADELLKQFNVVVGYPTVDDDATITFTGLPENINNAIQSARTSTSKVFVDTLDISKAHGGNLNHARALAAYFQHSGILSNISSEKNAKVNAPSYEKLAVESSTVPIEIVASTDNKDASKNARAELINQVNKISPSRVLFITDINAIFKNQVNKAVESASKSENVYVLPLNTLSNTSNEIILISLDKDDDEFTPSQEEIDNRLAKVNASLDSIREQQADLKSLVLDVASEKQQFIEGPKGTTLKAILAERPTSIIKLHSDELTTNDDKIFIQGSKSDVSQIEKEIHSLLKDAENVKDIYSFESELKVPTNVLSRLIGKNGANLNQLREQFGVEVDVEKNPEGEKASLKITGYKFNVKEAETYIAQSSKRWADEISKTIIVPSKYRSSLIGSNGQYVKRLQTKYNVRIQFSQSNDDVTIRGPSRGVTKAEEELKELLDYEIENGYTKEITIPSKAISRVIGKSGDSINRIAADTGIDIKVQSTDKEAETRIILLTGSRKGLTDAEKQIKAIVKEVEDAITIELEVDPKYFRDILGPRGSTKQQIIEKAGGSEDKDYRRLLQIPEQGSESKHIVSSGPKKIVESIIEQVKSIVKEKEASVSEKFDVAKDKHRLIIGPSGSVRREIEDQFKVRLYIPNADDKSVLINLIGLPENIAKAKARIEELTADKWKEIVEVPTYLHSAVSERGAFPRKIRNDFNVEVEHGDLTNKAIKISSSFPAPPAEALGNPEEESIKLTILEQDASSVKKDENETIPWRLIGEDDDVAKVSKLIKSLITKFDKDDTSAFLWVKDPSVFGKIVGPQGSRLNNIRNKSGSQIYIPRNNDKVNNVIFLKGTKDSLEKAEKLIRAEIEK
ncbi:hypothetical protein WICMUC_002473 [Wickerhamomyces mucosus]|uniref:K Homology domain-containing protein n=1 Tax=Wickerhamomyces mucosus TaxID=1378264 RepID=A0A9P8PPD6_9ASCO|nr:hypothetical protein WICMUC_002473 [Wickerhamomyces mucosus]